MSAPAPTALAYRVEDAAKLASCHRSRIDRAISAGRLAASDLARDGAASHSYRITHDALVAWIEAGYPVERAA